MSFSDLVNKAVNANVNSFIERVASTYNLKAEELRVMWSGDAAPVKSRAKPKAAVADATTTKAPGGSAELNNLNKPELLAQCKARGLKTTGTKAELVARLSGEEPEEKKPKEKAPKAAAAPKASASKKEPAVVKSVQTKLEPVKVAKNSFGNHEHTATGLVFDKTTKKVVGKQNPNGKVDPLTDEHIEACKKYKLPFTVPENLNNKKATLAVEEDDGDEDALGEELGDEEELEEELEEDGGDEDVEEEVEEEFVDEE